MTERSWPRLRMGAHVPALVLGVALCMTGCSSSLDAVATSGKQIIIFVDFSESMRKASRHLIEKEFTESIIPSLGAGDRLLVAPINEKTFTDFHPLMEATFPEVPVFNGWADNTMSYRRELRSVAAEVERLREELKSQVSSMLDSGGSAQNRASPERDSGAPILCAAKALVSATDRAPLERVPCSACFSVAWTRRCRCVRAESQRDRSAS